MLATRTPLPHFSDSAGMQAANSWALRGIGTVPSRRNSMADEHSERGGMKARRLYADALGESRFETATMPIALKEFAPPAAPLRVSDPQPAENYVILEIGAKWGGAVPHPSP